MRQLLSKVEAARYAAEAGDMKILASPKRVNPKLDETSRKVRGFEDILGEDISSAAYTRKV